VKPRPPLLPFLVCGFAAAGLSSFASETLLDDFESGVTGWKFIGGEEFPGAKGALQADASVAYRGQRSYRLDADFSQGGRYVGTWRDLSAATGDFSEIRLRVKAEDVTKISVRITDASGQCHQRTGFPLTGDGQWQELVLKVADLVGGEHWGGANDGRWHGPAVGFGINLGADAVHKAKRGKLWLDDVRVVSTPAAQVGIRPCTLPVTLFRPAYGGLVTYHWDAAPLDRRCQAFVHVRDTSGRTVFQADHDLPVPSTEWSGAISDEQSLSIPADLAPGEYRIVAGLWDPKAGSRLPLKTGPGVTETEPNGYLVGSFRVASDAPLPVLAAPSLNLEGYRVTFDEDFSGPLDVSPTGPGTRWIAHTPFFGDFGDAKFANPREGFPFTVRDGILRIEARKIEGRWESGLLASVDPKGQGFAQKFGYFEMRAKLPKGPGVWPAFWLMGQRGVTDKSITNIEIDVLEQYGVHPNTLCTTVHFWGPEKKHRSDARNFIVPGMTDDFHRYGVLITGQTMIFYYDGVELRRLPTPEEAKVPVYPLVNLALGSGWPIDKTPDPSVLEVDYVRIWSR